jgi:hypothetical protein
MIRQALFSADSGPEVPWYWRERPVLLLFTILFGVMMVGGAAADVPTVHGLSLPALSEP